MTTRRLSPDFEVRNGETRDQISTVVYRWRAPSPYRSFAEYQRALAVAYQARERFYEDVIQHATHHGPYGLLFTALLDAQSGCRDAAEQARRSAFEAARFDQEQAFASYPDTTVAVA
jgi:hypothetical protein